MASEVREFHPKRCKACLLAVFGVRVRYWVSDAQRWFITRALQRRARES